MAAATVTPHVHQIEIHPGFPQTEIVAKTEKLGTIVQAYGPLGDPDRCAAGKELLTVVSRKSFMQTYTRHKDATVTKIATAHQISAAQVLLAWQVQQNRTTTPRVEKFNVDHMKVVL